MTATALDGIADYVDAGAAAWLNDGLAALAGASRDESLAAPLTAVTAPSDFPPPFGAHASPEWRRFAMAALLADWAAYPEPADRVDFARLLSVLAAFPAGFRVWLAQVGGRTLPIGYTGWYPIPRADYELLTHAPERVEHRGFTRPLSAFGRGESFVYIFNYSIIPALHGTAHSRTLLSALTQELAALPIVGAAAVTVSPAGARVAERLGLSLAGEMSLAGTGERVYAGRIVTPRPSRTP